MPVAPTYPGVYIEEVPSGVNTITPVSTSIAAFLGRATRGPIDQAVRVLSLADFTRTFGPPHPRSDLADSVRLFFLNGGADCYVVRLARGADAAAITLRSLDDTLSVLTAEAKAAGAWANTVRLEVDYNTTNPDETFNLRVIHESEGAVVATESFLGLTMDPDSSRFAPSFVTQSSELIELRLHGDTDAVIDNVDNSFPGFSQARRPFADFAAVDAMLTPLVSAPAATRSSRFEISVNGSPYLPVDLNPQLAALNAAVDLAGVAAVFNTAITSALAAAPAPIPTVTTFFATAGGQSYLTIVAGNGSRSSVRVRRAATQDLASALMLGLEQGGIEPTRWSNFRPAPTAALQRLGTVVPTGAAPVTGDAADILDLTGTLNGLAVLLQNAFTGITLDGTAVPLNVVGGPNLVTTAAAEAWFRSAPVAGSPHGNNDGVREKLRIIGNAVNANPAIPYRAEVWGYHLALVPTSGTIDATVTTLAATPAAVPAFDSLALRWSLGPRQFTLGVGSTSTFVADGVAGDDGLAPDQTTYLGDPNAQTGLYALDPVDIFNLMVIPGDQEVAQSVMDTVWGPASVYCATRRAFLLIDPPEGWTSVAGRPQVVQDTSLIDSLRSLVVKENSAVFYPRLRIVVSGLEKVIGPAGAVAGLMARIDTTRGVWKAPAGVEADLRGLVGLQLKLTDMENGVLNKRGGNVIRVFPSGFTVWGARTMAGLDDLGSEWKYIPIRRLALFLEESLFRGTKWVVFEPNDEPLWARIRMNLNAFMTGLFRQGAFQGGTPRDAFYVKCDAETTTQADRNLGIVNIEVGFAPLKPAEFVIIKIQQMAGDL